MTNEGMIPKSEILAAINAAGFAPDIATAIQNWLAEQPGDQVPQEAFMLHLAELSEIEDHMATTMGELAEQVRTVAAESQRLDDQAGVAELQIQKDGLAQINQYVQMAEQLVPDVPAQEQATSQIPAPLPPNTPAPVTQPTSNVAA